MPRLNQAGLHCHEHDDVGLWMSQVMGVAGLPDLSCQTQVAHYWKVQLLCAGVVVVVVAVVRL